MSGHQVQLPVSGAVLTIRRQPLDVMMNLQVRAMEKHTKPVPPKVQEEVSPGQFIERDNLNDDTYQNEMSAYEDAWKKTFGDMLLSTLTRICIVNDDRLKEHLETAREMQAAYRDIGMSVPDDIIAFALQFVIAVSQEDMVALMMEVFGKSLPTESQVALRASMFSSTVQSA
jgi:hypothetical protein